MKEDFNEIFKENKRAKGRRNANEEDSSLAL